MAFIQANDIVIKKYMLKVAIQILKNESEGESYATEILKQELERIEEYGRENLSNSKTNSKHY